MFGARKRCRIDDLLSLKFRTQTVSLIQNILTKNLEIICQVILVKTGQKMIVNLLMMVLIDLLSTKMECDYLNGWIKNGHIRKNLTNNGEPQRYRWGTQKKKKKRSIYWSSSSPVNIMSVAIFVLYDIWGFFFLVIEIISIAKLFIIVHFFILKHDKQTLSYIHTQFEGNKNNSYFSPIYFLGAPGFFFHYTENYWAWEVDAPVITWHE